MNRENTSKKDKFLCGCCGKTEEFNSEQVIFDYFGKEFTEYEYVIENLAIRPAPKKLLDLVPVHSTNISQRTSNSRSSVAHSEPVQSSSSFVMSQNLSTTGEGDFRKPTPMKLKVRDDRDDFISFKSMEDDSQIKTGEYCTPRQYNPPPEPKLKPIGADPIRLKPLEQKKPKDTQELRNYIRNTEYRTTKQILSDLCQASEESLNISQSCSNDNNNKTLERLPKPMPNEIKDTIEMLRFKRTLPEFNTRTEKKLFHTPGAYFAGVKPEIAESEKKSRFTSQNYCLWGVSDHKMPKKGKQKRSKDSPSMETKEIDDRFEEIDRETVDSMVQTEISKLCPCLKKEKRNLKWKIIINKHDK